MKLPLAALLLSLATTAHSWKSIDTATLQFWSPPPLCTQENFDNGKAFCSKSQSVDNINVKLDNTGATCYSNPMQYSSDGPSWFTWLAPDPNPNTTTWADLWTYTLFVPKGEPVPQCDERGVCPCDALNPIRGSDPADWAKINFTNTNATGYSLTARPIYTESGCAATGIDFATEIGYPTNFCGPFQGNITVEAGDPNTCVNQGITTAAKCGEACEKENLKKVVFANTENGEVACCTCTHYDRQGTTEVCEGANSGLCSASDTPSGSNQVGAVGAMLFVAAATMSFTLMA